MQVGVTRFMRRWWPVGVIVSFVFNEIYGWGFADLWDWAGWWEPEQYWSELAADVWPWVGYTSLLLGLGAGALLWAWRLAGGRFPRLMNRFRRLPYMRPTLTVVLSEPAEELGLEGAGFPALVNQARRELELADQEQKLQIATPIHAFGDFVSPLTHAPGDTGWLAVVLIGLRRMLPSEDITVRAALHAGTAPGISLELYVRNSLRLTSSLWHPPATGIPVAAAATPGMAAEETAHFFARPTAAWIQEFLDTCPATGRRGFSCEQLALSRALVEQGLQYRSRGDDEFQARSYELALAANHEQWSAEFNLAMMDLLAGRFDSCIDRLERVLRNAQPARDRTWYYAIYNLGTACLHRALASDHPTGGIRQAVRYRRRLVEVGDRFLAEQGWDMKRKRPATRRAPALWGMRWTAGKLPWRLRRLLLDRNTRPRRQIEDALRRDGPIGIAAAATALACALAREAIDDTPAVRREEESYVQRALAALPGVRERSVRASVWYNLACYSAISGRLEPSYYAFWNALAAVEPAARPARVRWAAEDPTLAAFTSSPGFAEIVAHFDATPAAMPFGRRGPGARPGTRPAAA